MLNWKIERIKKIQELAEAIVEKYKIENPTGNTGSQFKNEVFELNAFCWCEGKIQNNGKEESSDEFESTCPPNLVDYSLKICSLLPSWDSRSIHLINL